MSPYALTYPQLVAQSIAAGFAEDRLARLRTIYFFAERMADGVYRAQGVPLSCHLVRTSSIALYHGAPPLVVEAALVHAAYALPYFDNSRRNPWQRAHRSQVATQLGRDVESLLWVYHTRRADSTEQVERHINHLETYDQQAQYALMIHLCDELEDLLDQAIAFRPPASHARRLERRSAMVSLARGLSNDSLADALDAAYAAYAVVELPEVVRTNRRNGYELPRRHLWEVGAFYRRLLLTAARWKSKRKAAPSGNASSCRESNQTAANAARVV